MKSAARVEEESSGRVKEESKGALWQRNARGSTSIGIRMVHRGSNSFVPNL